MDSLGTVDPFGDMPAPIANPEAWPPNYADGWNDAVRHMVDAFPQVRAAIAALTPEAAPAAGGADVLAIIDKWMEGYDHMGTGSSRSASMSEREWTEDRAKIVAILAAPAPPADAVRAVVARLRKEADDVLSQPGNAARLIAKANHRRQIADELEAALSAAPAGEVHACELSHACPTCARCYDCHKRPAWPKK